MDFSARDVTERRSDEELPYKVASDEYEGRYLVANRDIESGEQILSEKPLVRGPRHSTKPMCLGCYQQITNASFTCPQCGWPMCGNPDCHGPGSDHASECAFFQSKRFKISAGKFEYEKAEPLYDVILPLRIILLEKEDPERHKYFLQLESHLDEWRESEDWAENHNFVVSFLLDELKMDDISRESIWRIFGTLYTNDFCVRVESNPDALGVSRLCSKLSLCFGLVSMCSHSCVPNIWKSIHGRKEGFVNEFRAKTSIRKGEKLTHNYEDLLLPTIVRQEHLKQGKKFDCSCPRCLDPTELGTHGSSTLCEKCRVGKVLLQQTQTQTPGEWNCSGCGQSPLPHSRMRTRVLNLHVETDALLNDPTLCTVDDYEAYLSKFRKLFIFKKKVPQAAAPAAHVPRARKVQPVRHVRPAPRLRDDQHDGGRPEEEDGAVRGGAAGLGQAGSGHQLQERPRHVRTPHALDHALPNRTPFRPDQPKHCRKTVPKRSPLPEAIPGTAAV